MKTPSKILLILPLTTVLLSGCASWLDNEADASRYAGLDCAELKLLAESYCPLPSREMFRDPRSNGQENASSNNVLDALLQEPGDGTQADRNLSADRRSIALARRAKDCG